MPGICRQLPTVAMNPEPKVSNSQRSRAGCAQCRRASRKCDEGKPICRRCARLSFSCDYRPRLVWKDVESDSPRPAPLRFASSREWRHQRTDPEAASHVNMPSPLSQIKRSLCSRRSSLPYPSTPTSSYLAPKVPDWKHIVDLNSIDFGLLDDCK